MTAKEFITGLFCRVDDRVKNIPNHYWGPRKNPHFGSLISANGDNLINQLRSW